MKKLLFFIISFTTFLHACKDGVDAPTELGISSYDPVAYFHEDDAMEGKAEHTTTYKGITYQFVSEKHKNMFEENPEKYTPAYNGWCAYAMGAHGKKVPVNPETYKITDGTLYLFYNKDGNNTLESWNKDEEGLKEKADANWEKLTKE